MIPHSICRLLPFRALHLLGGSGCVNLGRHRISVPLHDAAALAWIYWQPGWKSDFFAKFLPRRTGAFIDVGVNTGQTLADFLQAGSDMPYFGFEPNARCLAFLHDLVQSSQLPAITLVPVGLSNRNGLASLYLRNGEPVDSTATLCADLRPGQTPKLRRECIPVYRLDELWAGLGISSISLIKIDVEGGELDVLEGMTGLLSSLRPPILCEVLLRDAAADVTNYRTKVQSLAALLRQEDYAIHRIHKREGDSFSHLVPVKEFPEEAWTPALNEDCDYLFAPAEHDLAGLDSRSH